MHAYENRLDRRTVSSIVHVGAVEKIIDLLPVTFSVNIKVECVSPKI
jgi:hypothetical protein